MSVAAGRLRQRETSVQRAAEAVGYASESAFAAAFKRTMGQSPRRYARGAAAPGPSADA